jgi:hypothetical protein
MLLLFAFVNLYGWRRTRSDPPGSPQIDRNGGWVEPPPQKVYRALDRLPIGPAQSPRAHGGMMEWDV